VFASLLAFVPILMAIVSIMATFLVLWGVTTFTSVSMIVEFLVALIGLGVAIDYTPGSCLTRPLSGRCSYRPWCRCSGAGTGGCRHARRSG
jgi:hypothetical protein